MQNYVQPGEVLVLAAPYDRLSGQGALVGSIFGVAKSDVLSGADGEFLTEGVCELAKTSAQAWVLGDRIYWNTSTKLADNVPTVGQLIGYAVAAAANPSSTGTVALEPPPSLLTGTQGAVADLAGTLTGTTDGTMVDVAATAASTAGGSTPTAAQVDTGIATAVASIVTGVNEQNKELLTKVNAILAALRTLGLIHT